MAVDGVLINVIRSLNSQLAYSTKQPEIIKLSKLRTEAQIFNQKIDLALLAKKESLDWSPFLEKIQNLSGDGVIINRIFVQSLGAPAMINGRAGNEEAAINFRKVLSEQPQFSDVNLPLASLIPTAGGVNFTISFKIKSLQF